MREAVLALGSNLGDSAETLRGAVVALQTFPGIEVRAVSSVVETDPVGGPEQGVYLNAVVVIGTDLEPMPLLAACQRIEQDFARVREIRWGPRTLDIDVIAIDGVRSDDPDLTLPHPRAHERGFVLVPWLDADADAVLPGHGPVSDLLAGVDTSGVRSTDIVLIGDPS